MTSCTRLLINDVGPWHKAWLLQIHDTDIVSQIRGSKKLIRFSYLLVFVCVFDWPRLVKSESSDSLCSQGSSSSGTHPAVRSLRQQPSRARSSSSSLSHPSSSAARRASSGTTKTRRTKCALHCTPVFVEALPHMFVTQCFLQGFAKLVCGV